MESLVLEGVTKVFRHRPSLFNLVGRERRGQTLALDRLSLQASSGEVLALLGPNGSGKTTLLKLVSTMLVPDAGRVLVNGFNTLTHAQDVRQMIGFAVATERSFYPRLTARENLRFFAVLEDVAASGREARIDSLLRSSGLEGAEDTLVMKFSTGMYQKLGLARALLKEPKVLLLDEPARSLSPEAALDFYARLQQLRTTGTTILLATHNFDEANRVADRIAIIRHGRLAAIQNVNPHNAEELRSLYFTAIGSAAAS
ncbi:MAG TPA: ABC transporter ATP-binding protein [Terriglobales bacterium]|nr:ABC transporter ATP-binding protein [Terriglobales bacterium]